MITGHHRGCPHSSWLPVGLQRYWGLLLSGCLLLSGLSATAWGQIATDGSVGVERELVGPDYSIPDDLGRLEGRNVFHSFRHFNLDRGERATFTSTGSTPIDNIVARVTGGEMSMINGQIRSDIAGANLFLFNPSGMMFGANASLNLSGSFYVSTADELRLADGHVVSAHLAEPSTFSVASPAAFGFVRDQAAPIDIAGSRLNVQTGETLSIVGGDLTISGGTLQSPGGTLALASVVSQGEVPLPADGGLQSLQLAAFERLGTMTLSDQAVLSSSGDSGGTVMIRGGQLTVDNAVVRAENTGNTASSGTSLDIEVAGDVVLTNGAQMIAGTITTSQAGDIRMRAQNVQMANNATILNLNLSSGQRGNIRIEVSGTVTLLDRDGDDQETGILSLGRQRNEPSEVLVKATRLEMEGGVIGPGSLLQSLSQARAGKVVIEVEQLIMSDGAVIDSRSNDGAQGGTIDIIANELKLSRKSRITTNARGANGGDIGIQAAVVRLQDSTLSATVTGDTETQGGNISIGSDSVVVVLESGNIEAEADAGQGGEIQIRGFLLSDAGSRVSAASNRGRDGTIVIGSALNTLDPTAPLPQNFAAAATSLHNLCAERLRGALGSSFVKTGRDGVPADPSGGLPSMMVGMGREVDTAADGEIGSRKRQAGGVPHRDETNRHLPQRTWPRTTLMEDCPKAQLQQTALHHTR